MTAYLMIERGIKMTEEKLKQLAEFMPKYLNLKKRRCAYILITNEITYHITSTDFFEGDFFPPLLAHLAKREMEKRGLEYKLTYRGHFVEDEFVYTHEADIFIITRKPAPNYEITKMIQNPIDHENEYFALWSAIFEAVGGEK